MASTVAEKLISSHLVDGTMKPGEEIGLKVDQTLTQDATGTLVMLELEAMGLDRVKTELSAQYVDHNLLQVDYKNADDHRFLQSAARRFGLWYSRAGNGVSHAVHQERFGVPGKTLLGSDSHTPAAGGIGMLALGAGGLDVALAMAGQPVYITMPQIWGIHLSGELPDWVSAKDVILELLRRHGVSGGVGKILEFHGPGLAGLSAMDRHVIANMGTELGATSTVFPSDEETRRFLRSNGREDDWREIRADDGRSYDIEEEIDLFSLEPLIAMPTSPGNVTTVRSVAGKSIHQAYVGSSANPGYRDLAIVAHMMKGETVHPEVSLDINPASRQVLETLTRDGHLLTLLQAGARLHQTGCNGCIGMGQAPATETISLRTVPRNFPGRSGTREDQVCLVSPETAAAGALTGVITDPRDLGLEYFEVREPDDIVINQEMLVEPLPPEESREVRLEKGPNIETLPNFEPPDDELYLPVLLKAADDISTDEILRAGNEVLPLRSNIPEISKFCFDQVDETYYDRAMRVSGGHAVVGGKNYGQGSSREHAVIAPRYLGLRVVIAKDFARIHWQNLANFGILPLTFKNPEDYDRIERDDTLKITGIHRALKECGVMPNIVTDSGMEVEVVHHLSPRQCQMIREGGLINWTRSHLLGDEAG